MNRSGEPQASYRARNWFQAGWKQVEYAPTTIVRTGLTYERRGFRATLQYAQTSRQFTDAYSHPKQPMAWLALFRLVPEALR